MGFAAYLWPALSCCSASNSSFFLFFPKVPVIPVVYSSFTTFYNPKKNLFTSGTKEPEGLYSHSETGLVPCPCGDLVHKGVGGKRS